MPDRGGSGGRGGSGQLQGSLNIPSLPPKPVGEQVAMAFPGTAGCKHTARPLALRSFPHRCAGGGVRRGGGGVKRAMCFLLSLTVS